MAIKTIMSIYTVNRPVEEIMKMIAKLCEAVNANLFLIVVGIITSPPEGEYSVSLSETRMDGLDAELQAISDRIETAW
ncbi:hypothetical protein [Cohaesibacter celericrescens]|uniref:Uncharacterized protein n=1 Tax=Cohaesibacter celericrescens TaxID=2067669 RepID=A0A2N5XVJ3_9HYPH|nr:hypothetical protein [Cohaesibacter celericrescens]PLW78465.1 hypothetical protein C0081_04260 [Cohaesibacter celericrescens]